MKYISEIKDFLRRTPRFNVVLIKSSQKINEEELCKELDCEAADIQKLVAERALELEKIDGYTDVLDVLKQISGEVQKEGVLINIDFLLSCLDKHKRRYFFESVLQKTFPKPIFLVTTIFKNEVPDVSHQEFNYAKVIESGDSHET